MPLSIGEYKRKLEAGTLTAEERREGDNDLRKFAETVQAARPRIGRLFVKAALINYEKFKNPLYLWEAYRVATDYGLTIPEQARRYLYNCAEALTECGHRTPTSLLKALRLQTRGRGTYATRYQRFQALLNGPEFDAVCNYLQRTPGYETPARAAEKLGHQLPDAIGDKTFQRLLADLEELAKLDLNDSDI